MGNKYIEWWWHGLCGDEYSDSDSDSDTIAYVENKYILQ